VIAAFEKLSWRFQLAFKTSAPAGDYDAGARFDGFDQLRR
jgi:hypothetical protein